MNTLHTSFYKTPYGELILGEYDRHLCLCDWRYRKMRTSIDEHISKELDVEFVDKETTVLLEAKNQLSEYFFRGRKVFNLPLLFVGSTFRKKVWNALKKVPYGNTITYLELSKRLGNENAIRAIASANGANAIAIIVPCHRVIGSDGKLVGYAGGLEAKKKLLQLEGAMSVPNQLSLF
ncbi:MAG TPA: cysteine methyltransferase [Bacteroidales bacterium]|jgi:methylated-DNA-[protein]-cysteine S-methyltransferase|nr:cysteine methyltransferase [Bacteroidales bacterium]